jgi:hypothetical protein
MHFKLITLALLPLALAVPIIPNGSQHVYHLDVAKLTSP